VELVNAFQKLDETWKSLCDLGSHPRYMLITCKNGVSSYIPSQPFFPVTLRM